MCIWLLWKRGFNYSLRNIFFSNFVVLVYNIVHFIYKHYLIVIHLHIKQEFFRFYSKQTVVERGKFTVSLHLYLISGCLRTNRILLCIVKCVKMSFEPIQQAKNGKWSSTLSFSASNLRTSIHNNLGNFAIWKMTQIFSFSIKRSLIIVWECRKMS